MMRINNKKVSNIIALLFSFLCFTALFSSKQSFAAINKTSKGPHNGILRSAGKFQIELTMGKFIEVYLLDKANSKASTSQSSIKGQIYLNKREYNLRFWANKRKKKFVAYWPKPINTVKERKQKSFSIVLLPTRKKVTGIPVVYKMKQAKRKSRKNAAGRTNN